jgi:hypothetical protein
MVGFWEHLVEAIKCCHQDYWVEVFDAVTDKRLTEPFAPSAQVPDTFQQLAPERCRAGRNVSGERGCCVYTAKRL